MTRRQGIWLAYGGSGALWIGGATFGMQLGWPLVAIAIVYVILGCSFLAHADRVGPTLYGLWLAAALVWIGLLWMPGTTPSWAGLAIGPVIGTLTFGLWAGTAALLRTLIGQRAPA
ncbi:hypothetical protein [Nocardioides daejeonensis]|uniref:hypothetical protein n=1 Tax=Nocardioides daejeonensis TaxID=1046556 RepID=UPI000D74ABF7|nr:hypothetical protein [Nocardioides daejeonensis]